MSIFVKGIGIISPQETLDVSSLTPASSARLSCIEPDYKTFINPASLRRMSRIIKMGITAAKKSLAQAGIEKPDSIIIGSGLGCLEDTEKFTVSILENQEQLLTPTPFIQSTHNTVSGQIALQLECLGYNFTYVHRGTSFEAAFQDASLGLEENPNQRILVGGIDELTDTSYTLFQYLRIGGRSSMLPVGEGATFFVLSGMPSENTLAKILFVKTITDCTSIDALSIALEKILNEHNRSLSAIELLLSGEIPHPWSSSQGVSLQSTIFKGKKSIFFKSYCGEYTTASAFGMALAISKIKEGVQSVLLYNSFDGINHSFSLLEG